MQDGQSCNTKYTKGTNRCLLRVSGSEEDGVLVVHSILDNLIKGASGQAVQVANLMYGFDENVGLDLPVSLF